MHSLILVTGKLLPARIMSSYLKGFFPCVSYHYDGINSDTSLKDTLHRILVVPKLERSMFFPAYNTIIVSRYQIHHIIETLHKRYNYSGVHIHISSKITNMVRDIVMTIDAMDDDDDQYVSTVVPMLPVLSVDDNDGHDYDSAATIIVCSYIERPSNAKVDIHYDIYTICVKIFPKILAAYNTHMTVTDILDIENTLIKQDYALLLRGLRRIDRNKITMSEMIGYAII